MRQRSFLFLLLVIGLGLLSGYFYTQKEYKFGLDVKGGTRFTYRMIVPEKERARAAEYREQTLTLLAKRVEGTGGASEATVQAKGTDQFVIELPGMTDVEKAAALIGSSARIQFFDAKNVVSRTATYRQYEAVPDEDPKNPSISFRRRGSDKIIKPGDAEYATIIRGWGEPLVQGPELTKASMLQTGTGYMPGLAFNPDGARRMEQWSRRNQNTGQQLAAVLDGKVISIAPLQEGAIIKDQGQISGEFETEYVKNLVGLLNGGALPVDLERLSAETLDATSGAEALDRIVKAGLISFGVITVFLLVYYALPGFIALLALCLYVLFTLTALKLIGATFSIAAIAGFILSVGMAVDANVLVFERFKEEVQKGKPIQVAMEIGFKRALPAIMDSNACTILTSLVLAQLGTGPVKGFATTLIIGVLISLFTAITVTRSLLLFFAGSGVAENKTLYAADRNWFGKLETREPLKIVEKSRKWFLISALTIIVPSVFFFFGGFKLNVEFQGGIEAVYAVKDPSVTAPAIADRLEKGGLKGGNVKLGQSKGAERLAYITVPSSSELKGSPDEVSAKIATAAGLNAADRRGFSEVGSTVQQETIRNAVLGVALSTALIVLYLAFRFGLGVGGFAAGLRFAFSAVGALLHDIFVVFGLAALLGFIFKWEVSALFLTAMLTIIGFSVHDTIVIFDRIRENLHHPEKDEDFRHLINKSITQSFARSINTSLTVMVTLAILIFFGTTTPDLKFFVTAMLVGILSGTYSSIYNASPILYIWDRWIGKTKGVQHTLVAMAREELARQAAAAPTTMTSADGRTYGQVRRRNSAVDRSRQDLD